MFSVPICIDVAVESSSGVAHDTFSGGSSDAKDWCTASMYIFLKDTKIKNEF